MASPLAVILAMSILALLPTVLPTAQPLASSGCGARLILLAPCAPFVQGVAIAPSDACCGGLVNVYRSQPHCLCDLLNGSTPLPINHTLALQLPLICRLALPVSNDACPGLAQPPSVQPPISGDMGGSSAAVSPTAALPRSRTNNLLLGLNSVGKPRVEGASIAVVVILLLAGGAY